MYVLHDFEGSKGSCENPTGYSVSGKKDSSSFTRLHRQTGARFIPLSCWRALWKSPRKSQGIPRQIQGILLTSAQDFPILTTHTYPWRACVMILWFLLHILIWRGACLRTFQFLLHTLIRWGHVSQFCNSYYTHLPEGGHVSELSNSYYTHISIEGMSHNSPILTTHTHVSYMKGIQSTFQIYHQAAWKWFGSIMRKTSC